MSSVITGTPSKTGSLWDFVNQQQEAFKGLSTQEQNEFFHFWGRKGSDQAARANDWSHLTRIEVGERSYDLSDPQDWKAFQKDIADGNLDGQSGKATGNVIFKDGIITTESGKKYDIRKPEDLLALKADARDGSIDGKISAKPSTTADGVGDPNKADKADKGAGPNEAKPAAKPNEPAPPTSKDVPYVAAPDVQEVTNKLANAENLSWAGLIALINELIGAQEKGLKQKVKDLAVKQGSLDPQSPEAEDIKRQITELTETLKSLNEITQLMSNISKSHHDTVSAVIRNLA